MEDTLLAEVWQVTQDGETKFVVRMPVADDRMPVGLRGQAVYAGMVVHAIEDALEDVRRTVSEADAVTRS